MLTISSPAEVSAMIRPGWRVLDVGSGDRPFPKATMLVDRLPARRVTFRGEIAENPSGTIVRHGKQFREGDLEALPFDANSFDFVYASHVIEHVVNPAQAIRELERVAPRGYIECPRAWFEFLDGNPFHRWLINLVDGKLHFHPKTAVEEEFIERRRLIDFQPMLFHQFYGDVFNSPGNRDPGGTSIGKSVCHICVYWETKIPYVILPPFEYRTAPA